MSTPVNFFRSGRHYRKVFREGRLLLASEGMELQLQVLDQLRKQIKETFGENSAVEKALKVEVDPNDNERIIIRPGSFYADGYPLELQGGTDQKYKLGQTPADIEPNDLIRVDKTGADDGGISINFGGGTPVASGTYSVILSIEEQLITATDDPFLRSANLNEDTAEVHRIVFNFNVVESNSLDSKPIPYTGTAAGNLVNEVEITRSGSTYSALSTQQLSGSETIDGRNLEVVFDNGDGGSTAAFPITNDDLAEYIQGKLIDSNGVEYHITNMFVTPGNVSTVTMQLDLEKDRPVQAGTNQPSPVISDSVPYKIRKRDLYVTESNNLPTGKRFWEVARVTWDGSQFTNIEDLRTLTVDRPLVRATYYDPVSTTLPTGATTTIDDESPQNGDTVLFSNLAVENHRIYRISGVGDSIQWESLVDLDPAVVGDTVIIEKGNAFRRSIGIFDGTEWDFNDTVRFYSGTDYWEQSSLKTTTLSAGTTGNIFTVDVEGSENAIIDYSIVRGSLKETGTFILTSDGTDVDYNRYSANIGSSLGIDLFGDILTGDLRFRYTADAGADATIKYSVKRWSNEPGGPGGIPSYSGSSGGGGSTATASAAGSASEVQYRGSSGTLEADSDFQWITANNELQLGDLQLGAIKGSVTINDNQTTPENLIILNASIVKYAVIEYSIERNGERRVGRLLTTHNDSAATLTDDSTDTGGGVTGSDIVITGDYDAGDLKIQYTSSSIGNSGTFKFTVRKWQ